MVKQASRYIPALKDGAQLDARVPQNGSQLAGKIVIVPNFETEQLFLTASSTSSTVFVPDTASGTWQLAAVSARPGTSSTSGTLQVEVAGPGVAVGSGVSQLTGTVSLSGTANTTVNGTVVATPTVITPGSAVNVIIAGTLTGLANAVANVVLQRVS